MIPPIKAEMTPEELAEMEKLKRGVACTGDFGHGYRMGFIAGKLSALNHIINHSPLYNGTYATSSEGKPASSSEKRVAPKRKARDAS